MDLRTLTAWRYADLPVGTPFCDPTTTTGLVPLINQAWRDFCLNMPRCDSIEELDDYESYFLVLGVMAITATTFKLLQVLL